MVRGEGVRGIRRRRLHRGYRRNERCRMRSGAAVFLGERTCRFLEMPIRVSIRRVSGMGRGGVTCAMSDFVGWVDIVWMSGFRVGLGRWVVSGVD